MPIIMKLTLKYLLTASLIPLCVHAGHNDNTEMDVTAHASHRADLVDIEQQPEKVSASAEVEKAIADGKAAAMRAERAERAEIAAQKTLVKRVLAAADKAMAESVIPAGNAAVWNDATLAEAFAEIERNSAEIERIFADTDIAALKEQPATMNIEQDTANEDLSSKRQKTTHEPSSCSSVTQQQFIVDQQVIDDDEALKVFLKGYTKEEVEKFHAAVLGVKDNGIELSLEEKKRLMHTTCQILVLDNPEKYSTKWLDLFLADYTEEEVGKFHIKVLKEESGHKKLSLQEKKDLMNNIHKKFTFNQQKIYNAENLALFLTDYPKDEVAHFRIKVSEKEVGRKKLSLTDKKSLMRSIHLELKRKKADDQELRDLLTFYGEEDVAKFHAEVSKREAEGQELTLIDKKELIGEIYLNNGV
jgi:hypothetical protein